MCSSHVELLELPEECLRLVEGAVRLHMMHAHTTKMEWRKLRVKQARLEQVSERITKGGKGRGGRGQVLYSILDHVGLGGARQ